MKKRVSKSFTLLYEVVEELNKKAKSRDLSNSRYIETILLREFNMELEDIAHED